MRVLRISQIEITLFVNNKIEKMSKLEGKKKPDAPKTKIDASKAMVIMGFKTSRTLEVAGFDERRQILDAQLFTRMQEVQVNNFTIYITPLIRIF